MSKELDEFFGKTSSLSIDFEKELNKRQLEAVQATEGPVLIIAGAGSGKTRVLTYRLAKLIDDGVSPENILLLTFTNKAAREMVDRAKAMLDSRCEKVTACTYHSFCARILRTYYRAAGLKENFSILTPSNCGVVVSMLIENEGYSKDKNFPSGKDLANIYSYSINKDLSIDDVVHIKYPKHESYIEEIELLQEKYAEYKLAQNLVDYDDLILLVNKIFEERESIARKYSNLYRYIMVDEYQDSNMIQLELLRNLRQFENKNICVVGDDQQCIYGFRGSNFRNIINFPKQFIGTKLIKLIDNYRSNQEILDLSNAILNNATEKYEKQLLGQYAKGEMPKLVYTSDQRDEARYIFYKIWQYHKEGIPFSDIAVLIRSAQDSNQLEALIATESRSIPYKKYGGLKFFDKEIIQDIFAVLSILSNSATEIFWFRLLKLYPNIGKTYASKITAGIAKNGLEELLNPAYSGKKYAESFPDIYREFKKMQAFEDFTEQVDYIINNYYYKLKVKSITESKMQKTTKNDLLRKLDSEIEEAQLLIRLSKNYESAAKFLEAILLENEEERENKNALTISTIHSIKGLEFRIVFIMDCIDSVFPGERPFNAYNSAAKREHMEEIEEARRLMYVAVTRAKEDLYLMFPRTSYKYGKVEGTEISRFLEEDHIYRDFCEEEYI